MELAERAVAVVATNDVRFIDSSDFDAHEIRVAMTTALPSTMETPA
ncbi:hypothetical protein ACNKHT_01270 [Shigella flexneri]